MKTIITEKEAMSPTGNRHDYLFTTRRDARKWLSNAKKSCWNNDAGTREDINNSYEINYYPTAQQIESTIKG